MRRSTFDWIVLVLVLVGALNWGLVGLFQWDLVQALFGSWSRLLRTIYTLVGLSALYMVYSVSQE